MERPLGVAPDAVKAAAAMSARVVGHFRGAADRHTLDGCQRHALRAERLPDFDFRAPSAPGSIDSRPGFMEGATVWWFFQPPPVAQMKKRGDLVGLYFAIDYKEKSTNPKHIRVRQAAVDAVVELGGDFALSMLRERVFNDTYGPEEVRLYMIGALKRLDYRDAVHALCKMMGEPGCRAAAEEALMREGPAAFSLLVRHTSGREFLKRMGYVPTQAEMDGLISALDSQDGDPTAARALGWLRDPRGFEPLLRNLRGRPKGLGRSNELREAVVAALGDFGDPRAVEPLLGVLGELDCENEAIEIIARLGDERAIPALTRRWKQEDGGSGWYANGACAARDAIETIRQRTQANQGSA